MTQDRYELTIPIPNDSLGCDKELELFTNTGAPVTPTWVVDGSGFGILTIPSVGSWSY